MKKILTILALVLCSTAAQAQLNVVATTANMGMLARTVGGDAINVTVLAPPGRDAHYLEARPSMMAAIRRADLLAAVGAELEAGWLPAAIRGANNPDVYPGRSGYFEGAAHIELIETDVEADRAGGDVHPMGNPHFYMDPVRMAQVAHALAERLSELDRDNADSFRGNAERFERMVESRLPEWEARLAGAPGVVAYHKDVNYLLHRFGLQPLGYIEPLPGIPPTARHLSALVDGLRGQEGVVVHMTFQSDRGPRFVSRELGWQVTQLPGNVGVEDGADDYIALLDRWVDALGAGT